MKKDLKNVSLVVKGNVYFDGNVTSRTVFMENGDKKTIGFMMPGTYEFPTVQKEIMEIADGEAEALIEGDKEWISVKGGESFEIPAASSYKIKVKTVLDYLCTYIKD